MDIPILYEDNHLIIVEKPINIPVQADRTGDKDLLTILKEDIKIRYNKPGNVYLSLLHRLDRPVGGVIVFAKTSKAASRMADMFRRRTVQRKYVAIVRGKVKERTKTLANYLRKNHRKNIVHVVTRWTRGAKKAVLHYELVDRKDGLSKLLVTLETGRPHQIRVQLSAHGFPI